MSLAPIIPSLPATNPELIEALKRGQIKLLEQEPKQYPLHTEHVIHAGIYARTITMPANRLLIGALIKIPTLVITVGSAWVLLGDEWAEVNGYRVIPASAGRKQVFASKSPFIVTMTFPTQARTIEEAERQFTDECELLLSRKQDEMNTVRITEER